MSQGEYLELDSSDRQISEHISNNKNSSKAIAGQLERGIYDFYLKDKSDLIVLDLGANIGLFSIHVSDCSSKIFSVEPTPSHFSILQKNSQLLKNMTPLNYALTEKDGPITFFLDNSNSTMNSLVKRTASAETISVMGLTLKSIVDLTKVETIDFCKIDIEGSEYIALTQETVTPVSKIIKNLFIETHETHGRNFDGMADHFIRLFEANGYSGERVSRDGLFFKQK